MQVLGIILGLISGIVWEILSTSSYKEFPTLLPSFVLNSSGKAIHFHHWLVYFAILLIVLLLSIKNQKVFHPAILMILAFLFGAIIFNFYRFGDWYKFFK